MTKNLPAIQIEFNKSEIKDMITTRLGDKAGAFITSVLELCGQDKLLAQCDPNLVILEALKAAGLDLPLNKSLGFAFIIPYKEKGTPKPRFQCAARGFTQLAIRSGQYKHMNTGVVYEGEKVVEDRIKGTLKIEGKRKNENAIGYFAYMQLLNGFEKAIFWSKKRVELHAARFSKSYSSKSSPWKTDFDAMALKTMILQLIPKYGPMNVDMTSAIIADGGNVTPLKQQLEVEVEQNANSETIDIKPMPTPELSQKPTSNGLTEQEKQEILDQEIKESGADNGPAF